MSKGKKSTQDGGTPRWVIIAGALVAIGTLAWSVISHFIPESSTEKSPASTPVAAQAPTQSATATGSGSVAANRSQDNVNQQAIAKDGGIAINVHGDGTVVDTNAHQK